ncbi:MAG TPA: molecular chaperone TorD family protein [Thauera sp.]|uniref:TorD/DmsD family molecular chaperone n=1 Tax=Thauera sp. TaxID=1905334 RepID=UPI002CD66D81|nr:molecular chaperone TorD family protein [Thauera sp.]HRP23771.1 molecular chaperone TorD family protein [Thauera sp.]HRP64552.1 molecular chaperone TorD family protein [Thauera sp.]
MTAAIPIQSQPSWSDEDRARAEHYALLARLLHAAPDAALLGALAQSGRLLGGEDGALPQAWAALGAAAAGISLQAACDEFDALFISVGKPAVISNGSWYLTGFLQEEPLAELRADLAELGLGRRTGVTETEDHIAALAEVMRHLVLTAPDAAGLQRQRAFFERHIAPWYAHLAQALAQAPGADFYAKVGALLRAFMDIEREAFDMLEASA